MTPVANARMYSVTPAAKAAWREVLAWVLERAGVAAEFVDHDPPRLLAELWAREDLGAVMMCGLPFSLRPRRPTILAAPVPRPSRYGGRAVYVSDIAVRADSPARTLADTFGGRAGYTLKDSQSGYFAFRHHLMTRHRGCARAVPRDRRRADEPARRDQGARGGADRRRSARRLLPRPDPRRGSGVRGAGPGPRIDRPDADAADRRDGGARRRGHRAAPRGIRRGRGRALARGARGRRCCSSASWCRIRRSTSLRSSARMPSKPARRTGPEDARCGRGFAAAGSSVTNAARIRSIASHEVVFEGDEILYVGPALRGPRRPRDRRRAASSSHRASSTRTSTPVTAPRTG